MSPDPRPTAAKRAPIVLGWNFEVCGASQWFTPDGVTFFVIARNTDGTFFFGAENSLLTSLQNQLVAACQHAGGGYFIHIFNSAGAFDSVLINYPLKHNRGCSLHLPAGCKGSNDKRQSSRRRHFDIFDQGEQCVHTEILRKMRRRALFYPSPLRCWYIAGSRPNAVPPGPEQGAGDRAADSFHGDFSRRSNRVVVKVKKTGLEMNGAAVFHDSRWKLQIRVARSVQRRQAVHVVMLLYPRFQQLDLTRPFEVLARFEELKIHLVWKTLEPVRDVNGLRPMPTETFANCRAADILFVPGGPGQILVMEDTETLAFLHRQGDGARYVTSVCTSHRLPRHLPLVID